MTDDRGIRCRHCGCRRHTVRNTVPKRDGSIIRYRICRNPDCGKVTTTREAPIGR